MEKKKWHNDIENFSMCPDYTNAYTEDEKKDRQSKERQLPLHIGMQCGLVGIVQQGQHL